jgi:hypothetical protein
MWPLLRAQGLEASSFRKAASKCSSLGS